MRKNVQQVYTDWIYGKENRKQNSIWTDGKDIYSYNTCLVVDSESAEITFLNTTKYSPTTTNHQNSLRVLLEQGGFEVQDVDFLYFGISAEELLVTGLEIPCED